MRAGELVVGVVAWVLLGALSGGPAGELLVAQGGPKALEQEQESEPDPAGQEAQRGQEEQTGQGAQSSGSPRESSPFCLVPGRRRGRTSSSAPGLLGRRKPEKRHSTRRTTKGFT